MKIVIIIIGFIVAGCGVVIAFKKGRNEKDTVMQWVLFLLGIILIVLGKNL